MRVFVAFICLLLLFSTPAYACSVVPSYRVPTNLELASDAELILIGRVESGPAEFQFDKPQLVVTPLEVLKGQLPATKPLKLMGSLAEPRFSLKSDPARLVEAHPLSYIGGCFRYMFPKGTRVLFFVSRAEAKYAGEAIPPEFKGALLPAGGAFSRWAEDVPNSSAPWVTATRIYVAANALPAAQQRAFLEAKRDAMLKVGDGNSKIVAADIDRQLAGPNKTWHQEMEEEVARTKRKE